MNEKATKDKDYKLTKDQIDTYKANKIPAYIVNERIRSKGWTIEEAISKPSKYKNLTPEQITKYKNLGLSYSTVRNRINKLGWTIEKAISTAPTRKNSKLRPKNDDGTFKSKNKGKYRTVYLNKDYDELVDKAIEESGLTQSDYIAKGFLIWFLQQQNDKPALKDEPLPF